MLPDAGGAGEAQEGGASVCLLEQLRENRAEMRVLQWFRGVSSAGGYAPFTHCHVVGFFEQGLEVGG